MIATSVFVVSMGLYYCRRKGKHVVKKPCKVVKVGVLYHILLVTSAGHYDTEKKKKIQKLGIEDISMIDPSLSATQMVWPCTAGHVLYQMYHKLSFPIPGTRKKEGLGIKTWSECVEIDANKCSLASIDSLDRNAWRAGVRHSLVLPTP